MTAVWLLMVPFHASTCERALEVYATQSMCEEWGDKLKKTNPEVAETHCRRELVEQ